MNLSSWLRTTVVGQVAQYCMPHPDPPPVKDDISIEYAKEESSSEDIIVVDWDGPDDPENPQNWPTLYKAWVTALISVYSFVVYCGSSIVVPSYEGITMQFGTSHHVVSLVLALYVIGYGAGPLLFSPISEVASVGRNPPYIISFAIFLVISIVLATVNNFPAIVVLRFFQGFFGSPCLATGGASLQDIYSWNAVPYAFITWVSCIYCGPALGPLFSSKIVYTRSWHWTFWEISMMAAPIFIFMACLLPETYGETILLHRARRLRRQNLNSSHQPTILAPSELKPVPFSTHLRETLSRPIEICIKDPAIGFTCLYTSFIYAIYYSFFEAFDLVYMNTYHMDLFSFSLIFVSIVIGCVIAAALYALYLLRRPTSQQTLVDTNNLEACLFPALPAVCLTPIGLFLFAWTARESVHWVVPTIGIVLYAGGTFVTFQGILVYLPPSYPQYVASLLAGNDFARSATAAIFIMVTPYMYENVGISKGVTILAAISCLGVVGMFLIWKYGARLRARSRFAG
ncbi:putative benomyl/methotrexate resistance protein [Aspergillus affinis]|uniref:putative benomyl/methotrexate resistance protein n=1 Tax=Aspergillus affinis TaxID=1070780 RepID=UPI0022FE76B1|nr:putative benomyl/methotrexate resistance protein [Aspergillus affinis]KAI9043045.1 putative benomyl/methotrexate resistance protein [Aspergillus affinis]